MITLKQKAIFYGHTDFVEAIATSSLSGSVMTGGRDGKVLLWNSCLTEPIFSWIPYNGLELYHADISSNANMILACHSQYKEAAVYNKITHESRTVPLLEHCHFPIISGDGNSIISCAGKIIYRVHLSQHKGIECIYKASSVIRFCQFFREKCYALILSGKGQIQIVDITAKMLIAVLPQRYQKTTFIAVACDESLIAVGDNSKNVIDLWKIELCSNNIAVAKIASFNMPDRMKEAQLGNARVSFINESQAFVCDVPTQLSFIDFGRDKLQTFDYIGYCNNYFIDHKKGLIYLPYGKANGSVIVFSY